MTQPLRTFRYYELLVIIFVVVLLISNLVGQKILRLRPFSDQRRSVAVSRSLIFLATFSRKSTDTRRSRRAIWLGFLASGLLALMGVITVALPPAPDWPNQQAFATVFNFVPRLVAASLAAFWCGEFANSFVMAKMKILTGGRHLWTRTVGSTVVGQAVDTIVLMIIAFGGSLSTSLIVNLIVSGYLGKVLYEVLATPFTYAIVNGLKRAEGVDPFDYGTRFSPFTTEFR